MDKITGYRKILMETLEAYASAGKYNKEKHPQGIDTYVIFDKEHDHYQVLSLGWQGIKQTCLVIFHFAIQDGKIWLHRNVADYDILADLESKGIPKEDIVLAYQPPHVRAYTGYAVA